MNKQNKKMELLGSASISKALLAMGLPTMIGMMINALYNLVDAYFIGGLGTSQMGAITVAYPLGQVVVGLGLLFGNGAAIATAISQLVSTLIYLWYIFSKKSVFSFRIGECCFSKEIVSEILKIGVPTLVFQLLTSLSIALVNDAAKGYGDSVLAAMGSVTRIMSVGSLMVFGFIKGFQPIAGYSYGAQQYDRLQSAIKVSIIWSMIFCVAFGLVISMFSQTIISSFTKSDMEMIRVGQIALRANGLSFICFGFYTVYSSLFLALGQAKEGFFLGACRQGICFVPVILMSPMLWGIDGILYAQPISDVLSVMITALMAVGLHKKLNTEKEAFIFKNPLN